MNISIEWHGNQFNVLLASQAGREAFLTVKGCRIAKGSKGEFVSWPATKNSSTGKWWNHVYASDRFNATVLDLAKAGMPESAMPADSDTDDNIPF